MASTAQLPSLICRFLSSEIASAESLATSSLYLAIGRANGTVDILDSTTYNYIKVEHKIRHTESFQRLYGKNKENSIKRLFFLEDNETIVSAGSGGTVDIWSVSLSQVISSASSYGGSINDAVLLNGNRLFIATEDGAVREFEVQCGGEEPVFRKVLFKEPNTAILSIALYGPDMLVVGTSNSLAICYSFAGHAIKYKVKLALRSAFRPASKRRAKEQREEVPLDPKQNIISQLLDNHAAEEAKKLQADRLSENNTSENPISAIVADFETGLIGCGDSEGYIIVLDPLTFTVVKEFQSHKSPVKCFGFNQKKLVSGGLDGRALSYSLVPVTNEWTAGVVRYPHLIDITAIAIQDNNTIVVGCVDGTLAIYDRVHCPFMEFRSLPLRTPRIMHDRQIVHVLDDLPLLFLETSSGSKVTLWTIAKDKTSVPDIPLILQEARDSLTLSSSKSLSFIGKPQLRKWVSGEGSANWAPVRILSLELEEHRLRSAVLMKNDGVVQIVLHTSEYIRVYDADIHRAEAKLTTGSTKKLTKFYKTANQVCERIFFLGEGSLFGIAYTEFKPLKALNHGLAIYSIEQDKILTRIDSLASPVVDVHCGRRLLLRHADGCHSIFSAKKWSSVEWRCSIPSLNKNQLSMGGWCRSSLHPTGKVAALPVLPNHVAIFDESSKSFVKVDGIDFIEVRRSEILCPTTIQIPVPDDNTQSHVFSLEWMEPMTLVVFMTHGIIWSYKFEKSAGDDFAFTMVASRSSKILPLRKDDFLIQANIPNKKNPIITLFTTSKAAIERSLPAPPVSLRKYGAN